MKVSSFPFTSSPFHIATAMSAFTLRSSLLAGGRRTSFQAIGIPREGTEAFLQGQIVKVLNSMPCNAFYKNELKMKIGLKYHLALIT